MPKSYKLITNANELLQLHEAAKKEGKREVGVSKGGRCYIWNEATKNIQTISDDEAALRLNLTIEQIHQILETKGEVEFIEDIEKELVKTEPHQVHIEEIKQPSPVVEEAKVEAPVIEATPVVPESKAPEAQNATVEEDKKKALVRELIDDTILLLLKYRHLYDD